ncbi:hypothetical protein LHYA1_G007870 [Lachnellula hyalina]|uniref:Inheritance of peroxisomes protein 1 n=1 Tax=Lachnellula hyalina TaxID=1316788 RepID=A0A8H8QX13_9HELO|nr:uncharacterized protein LHYA1_G007870 [Lachnellula hyalina]TVY23295.1 hypothetical protein LHYA1_G007870 [Lachnellula hyalina]
MITRSFSQPVARTASTPDPQIEVLYNLPSVRIVAFTTPNSIYRPGSSHGSPAVEEDAPGTLPWVSRYERTIAIGCVDGDSKFVLQIRRPNYWRIEVPNENAEDKTRIQELKEVLSKVLLFEKTPCPFQRDFVIELPEAPKTPIKKRPWKPVERQSTGRLPSGSPGAYLQEDGNRNSPILDNSAERDNNGTMAPSSETPAASLEPQVQQMTNATIPSHTTDVTTDLSELSLAERFPLEDEMKADLTSTVKIAPTSELETTIPILESDSWLEEEESDTFSDATDDTNITPTSHFQPTYQPLIYEPDSDSRPTAMQNCSRSITAPPLLSLVTSPPSKQRTKSPLGRPEVTRSDSDFSSSVDSFHSVQSWHSPLDPPSPQNSDPSSPQTYPYPHSEIILPKRAHARDISELTAAPETPKTPGVWKSTILSETERSLSPPPKTPTLINDATEKSDDERPEAITPPTIRPNFRHRATTSSNSRRRQLSPLPAAVNLFSPPRRRRSRRLQTTRHLPTAILQTTAKILLSPPSHLLHLMINIASKIAAGEWRGFLSNQGENVYWDFEQEYGAAPCNEDDFGISITPKPSKEKRNATTSSTDVGGSWEVD